MVNKMSIVVRKEFKLDKRKKTSILNVMFPQDEIDKIKYYQDEIKRLQTINEELEVILKTITPLELFREMLSLTCLQTLKKITIIQCSEHMKKMGCKCANRIRLLSDYLNTG